MGYHCRADLRVAVADMPRGLVTSARSNAMNTVVSHLGIFAKRVTAGNLRNIIPELIIITSDEKAKGGQQHMYPLKFILQDILNCHEYEYYGVHPGCAAV